MDAIPVVANAVGRALALARASWPTVSAPEAVFTAYLEQIGALPEAVETYGADLALACACASGDEDALSIFERLHISLIPFHVTRLQLSAESIEELQQLIRVKLFTGSPPRILRYSGKGPLGAWLRILSIRLAIDELKAQPRESQLDAKTLESFVVGTTGAEDRAVKIIWQPRLREAIEASLAELPTREKTVLRLHYIEGLNIEAIGTMYQVHRATVARWLLAIRASVLDKIRERLSITLPSTTSEIRSGFAELESELHVSISRVLGADQERNP
jgi:RNA polymerase sigma-70 factor (ECF subfamily)